MERKSNQRTCKKLDKVAIDNRKNVRVKDYSSLDKGSKFTKTNWMWEMPRRCMLGYLKKLNLDKIWRKPIELNWVPYHMSIVFIFIFIFFELIFSHFESENLNLYQNIILAMYLNMSTGYLSNIECIFVMSFDYHDNIL